MKRGLTAIILCVKAVFYFNFSLYIYCRSFEFEHQKTSRIIWQKWKQCCNARFEALDVWLTQQIHPTNAWFLFWGLTPQSYKFMKVATQQHLADYKVFCEKSSQLLFWFKEWISFHFKLWFKPWIWWNFKCFFISLGKKDQYFCICIDFIWIRMIFNLQSWIENVGKFVYFNFSHQ